MGRRRLSTFQRKALTYIGLFVAFNLFIITEYINPRKIALSLDVVYDPLDGDSVGSTTANDSKAPRVLLVSALFTSPDADATSSSLSHFLGQITTDVYLYTTANLSSTAQTTRGDGLTLTIDTSFSSPFDIPPLKGRRVVYQKMHALDPEKARRSPELYALGNAKPFFLERALRSPPRGGAEKYDYVFWVDIDAFREDHPYTSWPDIGRLERVWQEGSALTAFRRQELILLQVNDAPPKDAKAWVEDDGPMDVTFAEASFLGGPPAAIRWFSQTFYTYHNHYLSLGFFVGKSYTIYNALAFLFPSHFITVWASDPSAPARGGLPPSFLAHGPLGTCGQPGRYYQWWLSDRETRETMNDWWMYHDGDAVKQADTWWKVRIRCRLTRVLGMEAVLRKALGQTWKRPSLSVKPKR